MQRGHGGLLSACEPVLLTQLPVADFGCAHIRLRDPCTIASREDSAAAAVRLGRRAVPASEPPRRPLAGSQQVRARDGRLSRCAGKGRADGYYRARQATRRKGVGANRRIRCPGPATATLRAVST